MRKTIEPNLRLIKDYLGSSDIFSIPEYQRKYSWTTKECDKLWQDIDDFANAGGEDPYFFGTIIADCSERNKLNIIDGQQRTTTFLLFCKALQLVLSDILANFKEDEDSSTLKRGLANSLDLVLRILYKADDETVENILDDWDSVEKPVILENKSINEEFKDEFHKILSAKNFDIAEKSVHRFYKKQKDNKYTGFFKNFKSFYEKLEKLDKDEINKIAKCFLGKCQVVEIRSWDIEQAIAMFNSLNSTGMPLDDSDIISAQLYANANDDKEKFNSIWENLVEITNNLEQRKIVNLSGILQEYMYIQRAKDGLEDVNMLGARKYYLDAKKELLKDPVSLSSNFLKIAYIWVEIKENSIIKLLLKFNENAKFFLISYLFKFEKLEQKEVENIAVYLLRLFVILDIVETGYSSSNFKSFLFRQNVNFVKENYSFEKLNNELNEHINNFKEDDLRERILSYDNNPLVFLNEFLYAKSHNLKFNFNDSVNIEHIMPASGKNKTSIQEDAKMSNEDFSFYVNCLGNKILLEENVNKSISNAWFKTKKQSTIKEKKGYKDSKYHIASALVNYESDQWTKDDIEKANEKVADRIIKFLFDKK
ncbi:DUF262 domain-containing HNH endonuclease family protein [Campylobacter sp.]|uniref:DUF262 domain-containing protein n=1 Tax=Campylobacter sp. TaxID=205 RepID=UPI002AA7FC4C|nr:DUF262 domain-containing HNH endonuclease family protein [Campylobacter sp.]MCI7581373.1 DUF262 domain-containing HNH endonuclease family protein [Campylobacter sp.]